MSTSTPPTSNPPGPPPRNVSGTTLILSLAVGVCATAAIVQGVLYFWQPAPGGGRGHEAVLEQHDTVSPQNKLTGMVNYPIPYGSPPSLLSLPALGDRLSTLSGCLPAPATSPYNSAVFPSVLARACHGP